MGYIRGGIKTQSDFLTAKQKRELNGEIKLSNLYDDLTNVPQLKELDNRPREEACTILTYVRDKHKQKDIAAYFGISTGTLPYWYEKFGLDMTPRNNGGRKPQGEKVFESIEDIPKLDELIKLPKSKQAGILVAGRGQFGVTALRRYLGVSQTKIYAMFKELGIKATSNYNDYKDKKKVNDTAKKEAAVTVSEESKSEPKEIVVPEPKYNEEYVKLLSEYNKLFDLYTNEVDKGKGFEISINAEMNKSELEERLLAITGTFVDSKKYKVKLNIEEL